MTTTSSATMPSAPAAAEPAAVTPQSGEVVVTLPPGLRFEDLEPEDTSAPIAPATPASASPSAPAVTSPAAPAEPVALKRPAGSPSAAAFARLRKENQALKREVQEFRVRPPVALPDLNDKDWEYLKPTVEAAGSMTDGLRTVWQYASTKAESTRAAEATRARQADEHQRIVQRVQRSQEAFRQTHGDFDYRLMKSGVWEEFQQGGETAAQILQAGDPAAEAYRLSTERLIEWGMLDEGNATPEPSPAVPVAVPTAPPTAVSTPEIRPAAPISATTPVVPVPLSPAAARVVEEMVATPAPPRRLRAIPSAGGPARAVMTDADLFRLRDTDPQRFVDVLNAPGNEALYRRFMGG